MVLAKEFDPERNQKFFFVKDWDDGIFPSLNAPNLTYMGHAFSGSLYAAMDEKIELMKPDTSIYSIMEPIVNDGSSYRKKIFNNLMTAEHCRLSLDNETVWPQYLKQFKNLKTCKDIILHDYDLASIPGSWDAFQEIMARATKGPRIGMKFPVHAKTAADLLHWGTIKANSTFYSVRYDGFIPTDAFSTWAAAGYEKQNYAQLEYYVSSSAYDQNEFIEHYLREIFKQVIISRSYRLKITLKYEDGFFTNPLWEKVIELFNFY